MSERKMPKGILEMPDNLDIDPALEKHLEMLFLWGGTECNIVWP